MRQNPSPSPATELWKRLIGLYGGDSVRRKYGDTPPEEWTAVIRGLPEYQLARGMRRLVYSGKAHIPTLPEFVKLCRSGDVDGLDEGPQKLSLPNPESQAMGWDAIGNQHLLGYITRRLGDDPHAYGRPASWEALGDLKRTKPLDAGPEFVAAVHLLVGYKNAWVSDMREAAEANELPADAGKAWWGACMQRAEAGIASERQAA